MLAPISVLCVLLADAPPQPPPPVSPPVTDVTDGTTRLARAIIARDLETLVALTPAPFSFDGALAKSTAEIRERWASTLDRHPVERLHLFGVEVLGYGSMVQRYGPPPARLSTLPLREATVGIANLGGRATLVFWRKRSHGWQAFAISD